LLLKSPIETNGMVRIAIEFVAVLVVLEMVSMWALGETLARTSELQFGSNLWTLGYEPLVV